MGILSRRIMATPYTDPLSNFWYSMLGGRKSTSGVHVDEYTSLNYSAVWAATRLLTGTISTLPRELFRQQGESKQPADDHPARKMFKKEPNEYQGGVVHLEQQFNYLLNWGNAFAEIMRDQFGRVDKLIPIHPSRIPPKNWDSEEGIYYINNDDLTKTPIREQDLLHVPGLFPEDDRFGKGVVTHAAESIGMGLATEQFGASFFGNGASPSVVLTHPRTLNEEAARNLRKSWRERFSGPKKANGVLVLEEGTTVTPLTIPPEQAQFLSTRQFNITEIARWYNVPPHLLRELSKSSFNNIESESLHYILISVLPWLVRWEDECNRQLLLDEEKDTLYFKFIVHGMLRGDMQTQSQFFREMFNIGVYDINEIRGLLDLNPVENGDLRLIPMNMTTLETASNPPAPPEPVEQPPADDDIDDSDEDGEDNPEMNEAAAHAMRYTIKSVLAGMVAYESRHALRFAKSPRDFEEKCKQFYSEKFPAMFIRELGPLLASCRLFGVNANAGDLASRHITQSREELLSLLDRPMGEFGIAVQETVDTWAETRAISDVQFIFGEN